MRDRSLKAFGARRGNRNTTRSGGAPATGRTRPPVNGAGLSTGTSTASTAFRMRTISVPTEKDRSNPQQKLLIALNTTSRHAAECKSEEFVGLSPDKLLEQNQIVAVNQLRLVDVAELGFDFARRCFQNA